MKIAQIICNFSPYKSGMGNSVLNFSRYLLKYNNNITIFTPFYKSLRTKVLTEEDMFFGEKSIKIKRLKPFFSFGNSAFLFNLFSKLNEFDVVHLHYPFFGTTLTVVLKKILNRKKIKLITHYHMDTFGCGIKGCVFKIYKKLFLSFTFRNSDFITCASIDYVKHSFLGDYYQKNKEKFLEIPFGVDLETFKCTNKKQSDKKFILFVGGLDKQHYFKGVENLIKSFKDVSAKYNNVYLNIVGKGDMEQYYKNIAKELNIIDKINFINNADNEKLLETYCQSDIFVLPSTNGGEAFGLVLLEAMSCGLPVIASNLPGVRSVFKNTEDGLTVEPNNIKDLTEKIFKLLENEKLAKLMGENGRKRVEEKYNWEISAERLNNLYCRLKNSIKL